VNQLEEAKDEPMDNTNTDQQQKNNKVSHRLFLDDVEYQAFTRRLCWSPDGSILLTPASCYFDLQPKATNYTYTVYGFSKHQLSQPIFMLPKLKSYATCIKFSPYLYKRTAEDGMLALPYQMIFAVGTVDQVLVYSTQ
jgi:chromatin assembly factor 1 subunit B